jgi:DNA-binding Xre family transcriptional regulator
MTKKRKVKVDKDLTETRMFTVGILSQVQLAKETGLDYQNLNRILNGANFSSVTLTKLSSALQCHPGEILQW